MIGHQLSHCNCATGAHTLCTLHVSQEVMTIPDEFVLTQTLVAITQQWYELAARMEGATRHTCMSGLHSGRPQTRWLGPMPHPGQTRYHDHVFADDCNGVPQIAVGPINTIGKV